MTMQPIPPFHLDLHQSLAALRRPALLVRAARFGGAGYNRCRDLKRMLGGAQPPRPEAALRQLLEREAEQEAMRRAGAAEHDLSRQIELLIAIIAEQRLLRGPDPR